MLAKLLNHIENNESFFDPTVRIDSLRLENDSGVLSVSVFDCDDDEGYSNWEIRARVLIDYRIDKLGGELTLHESNHVLTRQHTDTTNELFFKGFPRSAMETIGRLLVAHREVTGDWIPFERFFNSTSNLEELLNGGYGKLADGPTFLINAYMNVLSSEGLNPNALAPRSAKWWSGNRWLEITMPLVALVIGDSFLVAEGFEEQQLTPKRV